MAGLIGTLAFAAVATTTIQKTIVQLRTPATLRARVLEVSIGFHGTVNTNEPIYWALYRQSTAGTMTSVTARPSDEDLTETFQCTGGYNATVEPTTGVIAHPMPPIHPQTSFVYVFPKGNEIYVKPSSFLGLVVIAPAAVNCDGYIKFEE